MTGAGQGFGALQPVGVSRDEILTMIVFALLFAAFGYRISTRCRAVSGVTPWRLPSIVWALICLVLMPFGIVVELLAEFTTRPAPGSLAASGPTRVRSAPNTAVGPATTGMLPENAPPPDPPGPPVPRDHAGQTGRFGWYPDPKRRHELRYFDGRRWSDHVADGGSTSTDVL